MSASVAAVFGARLRAARRAAGMTQHEVGVLVGAREKDVGRWENGAHLPHADRLPNIALAVGASLDELFGLPPRRPPA